MLPCIFECVRRHVWALAEVCVVVAGRAVLSGKPGASRLRAVSCGCCCQASNSWQIPGFPSSLRPPPPLCPVSSSSRFHFLSFSPADFPLLSLLSPLFFPSTRGSSWQCAGAGDRKWVSGSAQATGSGWLHSGCNLSPISPPELLCTLQLRLLTIDSLRWINIIHLTLFY